MIAYIYAIVYIIKKRIVITDLTYRAEFYISFYNLMFLAFGTRILYFISIILMYKGTFIEDKNIDNNNLPAAMIAWNVLYYLCVSFSNVCLLLICFSVCRTWLTLIVKIKYNEGVRSQKLGTFDKRTRIIIIVLIILYILFTITELL